MQRWVKKDGSVSEYQYRHRPVPDWLRSHKTKSAFTPDEQNRILLNIGRIPVDELARLMGCGKERIYKWAHYKGIATSTRKTHPPRKPAKKDNVGRMMDLAERLRA